MLVGEAYDASDPDLVAGRIRARRLTQQLGALDPADVVARDRLLQDLLGELGTGASVEKRLLLQLLGTQIRLGAQVLHQHELRLPRRRAYRVR